MKHNALTIAQIVHVTGLACYTVVVVLQTCILVVVFRLRRGTVKPTAIIAHIAHHGGRMRLRGTNSISRNAR
jgi:hypothetical protein